MRLSVVIVDDEAPARRRLIQLIESSTEWVIGGEAANCKEAIERIERIKPDVLFLDIQLTDGLGFEVLKKIKVEIPVVIFVSAFDQYAIQAFDHLAIDFLLKPYTNERFVQTAKTVVKRFGNFGERNMNSSIDQLITAYQNNVDSPVPLIRIKERNRLLLLKTTEISHITSSGNYCEVHKSGKKYLTRETISSIEATLSEYGFFRIHRRTIINLSLLEELVYKGRNRLIARLRNGEQLNVSSSYEKQLKNLLRWQG